LIGWIDVLATSVREIWIDNHQIGSAVAIVNGVVVNVTNLGGYEGYTICACQNAEAIASIGLPVAGDEYSVADAPGIQLKRALDKD
jgi:hypothetical protein